MAREKWTADTLYEVDGAPMRQEDAIAAGELVCDYFAGCARTASTAVEHSILGSVPACESCAAFAAK